MGFFKNENSVQNIKKVWTNQQLLKFESFYFQKLILQRRFRTLALFQVSVKRLLIWNKKEFWIGMRALCKKIKSLQLASSTKWCLFLLENSCNMDFDFFFNRILNFLNLFIIKLFQSVHKISRALLKSTRKHLVYISSPHLLKIKESEICWLIIN